LAVDPQRHNEVIASKIFPSLLTFEGGDGGGGGSEDEYDEDAFYALGGSYYEPDEDLCFGIVAITKECVAIQDEQLIEHLVESGLFSYLLSKRMLHSYSCHEFVMEAAKSLVSFNDQYLEKIESMELAEEIMECGPGHLRASQTCYCPQLPSISHRKSL
jgi:hypothetical protein